MLENLTRRGLAVVSVCLAMAAMTATSASASPVSDHRTGHRMVLAGTWSDPGAETTSITPDGTNYLVGLAGSTTTVGGLAGQSAYTFQVVFDPTTSTSKGPGHERFTASLADGGSGHLDLDEYIQIDGDGSTVVVGVIVGGDGAFRNATGVTAFIGTVADPTTSSSASGQYWMWLDLGR